MRMKAAMFHVALLAGFLLLAHAAPVERDDKSYEEEEYVIEIEEDDDGQQDTPKARLLPVVETRRAKAVSNEPSNDLEESASIEDEYSSLWGASSVEGSLIRRVLEEEDEIGVSFEELTRFQQEFGRRLGKSAKPRLEEIAAKGNPHQRQNTANQINRAIQSAAPRTASTTRATTTTTTSTTTTTTVRPTTSFVPSTQETSSPRQTTQVVSTTPTTTAQPLVNNFSTRTSSTSAPVTSTSRAAPPSDEVPESRDISESAESSSETSDEDYNLTTESFAEIQKVGGTAGSFEKQPLSVAQPVAPVISPVQTVQKIQEAPETVSVTVQLSNGNADLNKAPVSAEGKAAKVAPVESTTLDIPVTDILDDFGRLPKGPAITAEKTSSSTESSSSTEESTELPTTTVKSSVAFSTSTAKAAAVTTPASTTTAAAAPTTPEAVPIRQIPGRRISASKFRLASSTARSETADEVRPINVAVRRRPINRQLNREAATNQGASQNNAQVAAVPTAEIKANVAVTKAETPKIAPSSKVVPEVKVQTSGTSSIAAADPKPAQAAVAPIVNVDTPVGVFGQRIRKLRIKQ